MYKAHIYGTFCWYNRRRLYKESGVWATVTISEAATHCILSSSTMVDVGNLDPFLIITAIGRELEGDLRRKLVALGSLGVLMVAKQA